MNKILSTKQAIELSSRLRKQNKTIVLVGGVFDILHLGHVRFLENAKKQGNFLFILLESDKAVNKYKGEGRPINKQKERAEVLKALSSVDFVVMLKGVLKNEDYDRIVGQIRPKVLAVTKNDPEISHKIRQAKLINAKIKEVLSRIKNKSTTQVVERYE